MKGRVTPVIYHLIAFLAHVSNTGNVPRFKNYYLDELCGSINQTIFGQGYVMQSRTHPHVATDTKTCEVTFENGVEDGWVDLKVMGMQLSGNNDRIRIKAYNGYSFYLLFDSQECPPTTKLLTGTISRSEAPVNTSQVEVVYPQLCSFEKMNSSFPFILIDSEQNTPGDVNFTIYFKTDLKCPSFEYFKCKDRAECIPYHKVCDGRVDCLDGTDEDCHGRSGCPSGQFNCLTNEQCVLQSDYCDGWNDCRDASDELDCQSVHFNIRKSPLVITSIFFGWLAIFGVTAFIAFKLYRRHRHRKLERYRHVQMEDLHEIVNRPESDNLELYSV